MEKNFDRLFAIYHVKDTLYSNIQREIDELKFYFSTLEGLIHEEEQKEVSHLESEATKWTPRENAGDFWSENYPYWWKQVFATQLRFSFVVWAMAVLEHQLEDVCENCGILTGIEWNAERRHKANKRKGFIEIVRDFLVNKVGFGKPGNELWDKLLATYRIRNKLVHHGILIPDGSDNSTLAEDIRKTQGIEIKGNQLAITADFCNSIVSIMSDLFHQLREEHEKLCEKVE